MVNNIIIHICTKDRPNEVFGLLQSLRTQTLQDFNILILDDGSGMPIQNHHFIQCMNNRMQMEGHQFKIIRNNIPSGVSMARQILVDYTMEKGKEKYICRLDDDILIEPDYLEKLMKVINEGYDIASGITTPIMNPMWKREVKYISPIVGECTLNNMGQLIQNNDDCGYGYIEEVILPAHHFRSCALYKREIHEKGVDYKSRLSKHGFREEQIFSFKAIIKGFKIGVHTGANALHLLTPSGGERSTTNLTQFNQQIFEETVMKLYKKHGDFLQKYNKKVLGYALETPLDDTLLKSTNLVTRNGKI